MASSCPACGDSFCEGEEMLPCICCLKIYHASKDCTGISENVIKVFDRNQPFLVFRCESCVKNGGLAASYVETVNQMKAVLSEFTSLKSGLSECKNSIKKINSDIVVLREKCDGVVELKKEFKRLKSSVDDCDFDKIDFEIQDRISRNNNIIIHGIVADPNSVSASSIAKQSLAKINNINITSAVWLVNKNKNMSKGPNRRKQDTANKPISLKVGLKSRDEVFRIIKAKKQLSNGLSVSTDKTVYQRAKISSTLQVINEHNNKHPDDLYRLVFEKGSPRAISVDDYNLKFKSNYQ